MSFPSDIISILRNPAILIGVVPFIRLLIEFAFRKGLTNATKETLDYASEHGEPLVRTALSEDKARGPIAVHLDNDSNLAEFFQTCLFSAFSLVIWLLTQPNTGSIAAKINALLIFLIVVALVSVGRWSRKKYDSAKVGATKFPVRVSYFLAVGVVVFEVLAGNTVR